MFEIEKILKKEFPFIAEYFKLISVSGNNMPCVGAPELYDAFLQASMFDNFTQKSHMMIYYTSSVTNVTESG